MLQDDFQSRIPGSRPSGRNADHNLNVVHHNLTVFEAGFQRPPIRKLLKPDEWREHPEMVRSVPYMAALVRK